MVGRGLEVLERHLGSKAEIESQNLPGYSLSDLHFSSENHRGFARIS